MLKKIVISLEPEEQVSLERAVLDEDAEDALRILKERIYPKLIKEREKVHCMPSFELEARRRDGANEDNPWLKKKK